MITRNYLTEFKTRVKQIDDPEYVVKYEPKEKVVLNLYHVYKRAVPYKGKPLNKIIALNLLLKDAENMKDRLIRKEQERRGPFLSGSDNVFFSYDIVPADATYEEQSPFYNEGSPVL